MTLNDLILRQPLRNVSIIVDSAGGNLVYECCVLVRPAR